MSGRKNAKSTANRVDAVLFPIDTRPKGVKKENSNSMIMLGGNATNQPQQSSSSFAQAYAT